MKILKYTLLFLFIILYASAQTILSEINEQTKAMLKAQGITPEEYIKFKNYDYLKHQYKYLDKDFQIIISKADFNELIENYKLIPEKIVSYKDSLRVVLCGEFDTWRQINIAFHRLSFSWLRNGYILWLTESEAKELGGKYHFKMPYELYDYTHNHPELWDQNMQDFIKQLRSKIYEVYKDKKVFEMTSDQLLYHALVQNPVRIKDFERVKKERQGLSVGCGEPDCCQTKGSTREKCKN
jgi:hypothetical protein